MKVLRFILNGGLSLSVYTVPSKDYSSFCILKPVQIFRFTHFPCLNLRDTMINRES